MLTLGNFTSYVAGHDSAPTVSPRAYIAPHTVVVKPSGLDWDAITPVCGLCGQRRGDVNLDSLLCGLCAAPIVVRPAKVYKRPPPASYAPRQCNGCGIIYTPRQHNQKACTRPCSATAQRAKRKSEPRPPRIKAVPIQKKQVTCVWCSTVFESWRKDARFCQRSCGDKYQADLKRKPERRIPCDQCGQEFKALTNRARFCTPACSVQHKMDLKRADHSARSCDLCGTSFIPYNTRQRFCSHACKCVVQSADRKQQRSTNPRPDQSCERCGTTFTPRRQGQNCCSKACSKRLWDRAARLRIKEAA